MQIRFNIRSIKTLIWLFCLAVSVAAGLKFWDVYEKKQAGDYRPLGHDWFAAALNSRIEERDGDARSFYEDSLQASMWEALVNGEDPSPPPPEEDLAEIVDSVEPPIEALQDVVDIELIVWSPDPLARFAAVTYKETALVSSGTKELRLHLSEGALLNPPYGSGRYEGRVVEIKPQQVVFMWGGEEVALNPALGVKGDGVIHEDFHLPDAEDPTRDISSWPKVSQEKTPGTWLVGSQDVEQIRKGGSGPSILSKVSVRTFLPEEGGRTQLEVANVEEESVVYRLGVRTGDRIISVNGIPMPSMAAATNWFKANSELGSYTVIYQRAGRDQTMTYYVEKSGS
ncbi:MAG: hypothetical protein VX916_00900 [Planctomycetota bacterium]|nr:hypothetical protein [Planctomycetota bacterium]